MPVYPPVITMLVADYESRGDEKYGANNNRNVFDHLGVGSVVP